MIFTIQIPVVVNLDAFYIYMEMPFGTNDFPFVSKADAI